jgi:hypothetical protein
MRDEIRFDGTNFFCSWCGKTFGSNRFRAYGHLAVCATRRRGIQVGRGAESEGEEGHINNNGVVERQGVGSNGVFKGVEPVEIGAQLFRQVNERLDRLERMVTNENYHLKQIAIERNTSPDIWLIILAGVGAFLAGIFVGQLLSSGGACGCSSLGRVATSAVQNAVNYGVRRAISRMF